MPSRESHVVKRGKKPPRRRAEKPAGQKGSLLTAALSLNVAAAPVPSLPVPSGPTDPGGGSGARVHPAPSKPTSSASTFWQPIRSFALSQLTALVRRATLRESDLAPKYEKVHNFKVSRSFAPPPSPASVCAARVADSAHGVLFKFTSESKECIRIHRTHTHTSTVVV